MPAKTHRFDVNKRQPYLQFPALRSLRMTLLRIGNGNTLCSIYLRSMVDVEMINIYSGLRGLSGFLQKLLCRWADFPEDA